MSYEILTFVNRGVRHTVLKGAGEHEGTNLNLTYRELRHLPATEPELAAELDRRFLRKHHDRSVGEITGVWIDEWTDR